MFDLAALFADADANVDGGLIITVLVILVLLAAIWFFVSHARRR